MKFILDWVADHDSAPHFARKSWKPLRIILQDHGESVKIKNISSEKVLLNVAGSVSSMN
jgi:hypothetical protein